jgi:hypothetical protein
MFWPTLSIVKDIICEMENLLLANYTVAARSKAWVCGRLLAAIAGSNLTGSMNVCHECCVLLDRGFCVWLIRRPEESYRVWCVKSDSEASIMRTSWPTVSCSAIG